jgi:hypothetical protein
VSAIHKGNFVKLSVFQGSHKEMLFDTGTMAACCKSVLQLMKLGDAEVSKYKPRGVSF